MIKTLYAALATATLILGAGCASSPTTTTTPGPESHFAKLGTNRIHYVVEGKGKHTIVFVHCWSGNLGFWREQVPALADKARLILIDLPGHGQSDKPHTDYSMDFFAEAVLAVMRDAHAGKATLIGHSMGGPIICRLYKQPPAPGPSPVAADCTPRPPKNQPQQG